MTHLTHMADQENLIQKYDVAAPRYTSYPTVPMWKTDEWTESGWREAIRANYEENPERGVGVYVHLPFCESLCTYCGCNTRITKNHGVEEPYIDSLLKEWTMYKSILGSSEVKVTDLHLGGGTPTFFTPERLGNLIKGLLGGEIPEPGTSFSFEAHPANTSKEHLQTLYDLGFRRLSLGIQDFDTQVQEIINRKQTEEDVRRVMDQAREIGYTSINFDLIYGLPLQTRQTVRDTIERSLTLKPDRISFYSYAHVPWMKPAQRRFTEADLPVGEEKLALYQLGRELILQAGYNDVGMDHFATASDDLYLAMEHGHLHRNFMGYTDRHIPLLIGLGVSSIGDAWNAFAQNVKTVEAYHQCLADGRLPLLKGHLLSDEDQRLRRSILDIMCKGKTWFSQSEDFADLVLEGLRPLEADKLVTVEAEDELWRVNVTPVGQSFLRNICMAFDLRLARAQGGSPQFSQAV